MTPPQSFAGLIKIFFNLINLVVPVIAGLALLAFFWGLVKFISRAGGDEKAITEGKNLIKWGLVGLFIMVSVWGILRFLYTDIGFGPSLLLPLFK